MDHFYSESAPAKLNLRLSLCGRRSDGYHLLSMLNVETSLCDQIDLVLGAPAAVKFRLENSLKRGTIPHRASENIAARAAQRFQDHFQIEEGIELVLHKRIPSGAGLGGGSSDAAAVLRGLFSLYFGDLRRHPRAGELISLASALGADVVYFLYGGLCQVSGIGEKVQQLTPQLGNWPFILVVPSFEIATPQVYALLRQTQPEIPLTQDLELQKFANEFSELQSAGEQELRTRLVGLVSNQLSSTISNAFPKMATVLTMLESFTDYQSGITGSGSCLFMIPRKSGEVPDSDLALINQKLSSLSCTTHLLSLR